MSKRIKLGFAGPVAVLTLLFGLFVVAMRLKYAPVQDRVRQFARDYGNPRVMETAGQPGAVASIVRHTGRSSGASYETPVTVVESEDGFVVALPYGTNPDWLKNVLASGSAVVVHEGGEYRADRPELTSRSVGNPYFPRNTQLTHLLFGVDDFLLLRRAEAE